jgi:hypothetical protein
MRAKRSSRSGVAILGLSLLFLFLPFQGIGHRAPLHMAKLLFTKCLLLSFFLTEVGL